MRLPPFLAVRDSASAPDGAPHQGRRSFLRQLGGSAALAAGALGATGCRSTDAQRGALAQASFLHGVASGDPLTDRIILWTRVTPFDARDERPIAVHWQLASDRAMLRVLASGELETGPERDYTVKVDALGLQPGHTYFYRFSAGALHSPVGRTKTLPAPDVAEVKLAVFSCANYPAGYFNVYAAAAEHSDVDAALHIGDYIYEYDSTGYACGKAKELGRVSQPANLLLVLDDYRRRYAQYRSDPDLQAIHALLPFIVVWDDHEFADDAWRDGAAEHRPAREGPFALRRAAAMRAYHEWMPLRAPDPSNQALIYRSFDFGKVLSLHMLDTRIIGRDQQLDMDSYYDAEQCFDAAKYRADVASPRRQMMGAQQLEWLENSVASSPAKWQVLGQQVLMARMEYPLPVAMGELSCAAYCALQTQAASDPDALSADQHAQLGAPRLPCYLDSWDGYQGERARVFALMRRHAKDLVVLAGDTHNAWASDLYDDAGHPVGVEFAGPSVSSPGMECSHPGEDHAGVARMMEQLIGPLYYAQTSARGFMLVTASAEQVRCDWHFVDTVTERRFRSACERSLRVLPGQKRISELASLDSLASAA